MNNSSRSVSLVISSTTLLSGDLSDCYDVDDESCEGGIALEKAYLREHSDGIDVANLLLSGLDYQSIFVQMHPLNWNVNRLILRDYFGMECFMATSSLLEQHQADSTFSQRDLSGLQTNTFRPLLHGNVVAETINSWSQYAKNIHFDEATGLAIILIQGQFISTGSVRSLPPEDTARALINYVQQENRARGCLDSPTTYNAYFDTHNRTQIDDPSADQTCWTPVLIKTGGGYFDYFLENILTFENQPALLVNVQGHIEAYEIPQQLGPNNMWVVSYEVDSSTMRQLRLTIDSESQDVVDVTLLEHDLVNIPNSTKDDQLSKDISYLRELADEALSNDPIVGYSKEMPIARVGNFRACFGGECPIGNLFTDALRWYTEADFAFIQSGGVRGLGWPEGPVRVSDIWGALPFANTQCTGTISGVTVFKLFELATREAQYVAEIAPNGDRLFQVSGLRYTYNTEMEAPRLIELEILNKETGDFAPIDRLQLYKFATSSWMCSGFDPFPTMLSDDLVIEGEIPGQIGDQLLQSIVGEYLQFAHTTTPYDTTIQGRLTNDTSATVVLDLVQTEASCTSTTYWVEEFQTCYDCPSAEHVLLNGSRTEFEGLSGVDETFTGTANIVNGGTFPVTIALKSKPDWVSLDGVFSENSGQRTAIDSGEGIFFDYSVTAENLEPGVATGAVSFAVLDGGNFPGCVGNDLVFELSQNISHSPELVQEGKIRIVGFTMVSVIVATALGFAVWVNARRDKKPVKMMQPEFLFVICFGVCVIGLSILPRSLLGWELLTESGTDMACMANAWLLSMGFSLVISALLAKLWRINKVVVGARTFQRTRVSARSAVRHFGVQFVLNFFLLLAWTLIDPMRYEIHVVEGESWKLYGTCSNMGTAGWTFLGLTIGVNFVVLLLAVVEAYKARKLGEEYSESSGVGIAIFGWLQLSVVGFPVLFLIEEDSVNPRYFLTVSLTFACCMTMLLCIFVPLVMKVRKFERKQSLRQNGGLSNFRFATYLTSFTDLYSRPDARPPPRMAQSEPPPPDDNSIPPKRYASSVESWIHSLPAENKEEEEAIPECGESMSSELPATEGQRL